MSKMITNISYENMSQYQRIFDLMNREFSAAGKNIVIDSLNDYFYNLSSIYGLNKALYQMLPVDEPTFDIDANSRTVNVPAEFKKNGIGVKGDCAAEIIWFKVDRFFDVSDLGSDDIQIIIQWETTINKDTKKGISPALCKDINSFASENKLVFGWMINDEIAAAAGNVKFAVRFYRVVDKNDGTNAKELKFSLSTTNATVTINPGLDFEFKDTGAFDVNAVCSDDSDIFTSRFLWAKATSEALDSPAPKFTTRIEQVENAVEITAPTDDNAGVYNVDLDSTGNRTFLVWATISGSTKSPEYSWYKIDNYTGSDSGWSALSDEVDIFNGTEDYEEVTSIDTTLQGVVYYTKDGTIYSVTTTPADDLAASKKVYKKVNKNTISSIGAYKVIAKNTEGTLGGEAASAIVVVPKPSEFELKSVSSKVTLTNGATKLTAEVDSPVAGDKYVYTWTEDGEENTDAVTASDTSKSELSLTIPEADRALYDKEFKVTVKATRNKGATEEEELSFRVTDVPHAFELASDNFDGLDISEDMISKKKDISVVFGDNLTTRCCDKILYKWYKIVATDEEDPNLVTNDTMVAEGEITAANASASGAVKYSVTENGVYYCELINVVNDQNSVAVYTPQCIAAVNN